MEIRARESGDLPALVALAARVRRVDGYPVYLPNDDYERFLSRSAALAAFVAIRDGDVIGHVAVNSSTSQAAMQVFDGSPSLSVGDRRLSAVAPRCWAWLSGCSKTGETSEVQRGAFDQVMGPGDRGRQQGCGDRGPV